jgi:hypothetical protein
MTDFAVTFQRQQALKRMQWELRYGMQQAAAWRAKAKAGGATDDDIIAAVAAVSGALSWETQQAYSRPVLAQARRAIAGAFVDEHALFTPETIAHYRAAFLAVPETTPDMWNQALHHARNRYWRLTHKATGAVQDVQAYTISGAYTAAGWQPDECDVDGPRGISHAECDRRAAMGAEYPAEYDAQDRAYDDEEYDREQAQLETTGMAFSR